MNVPAGKHVIKFSYDPQSVHTTEAIAYSALAIFLFMAALSIAMTYRKRKQKN
jgi:hypothetical protein